MREARSHREAVADGVLAGYSEAMLGAGAWKGRMRRFWREHKPVPPEQAESAFDSIARAFPRALVN